MIYFLSVLQLLLLLITVSSKQCHERNEIRVSRGRKESSQSNYYYGIISTPNFPDPFPTPFNKSFIIDASDLSNDSQINVYLTQMYLTRGVRFFQRPDFSFCDQRGTRKLVTRQDCRKVEDQMNPEIFATKLHDIVHVSTSCPYLEIEVTIPELYGYHYRTRDPFLFDMYGFNITFEIVPEKLGPKNSCNPRNCSNLGHCYLADNWSNFFCDCTKGHPGQFCEYSPHCDPENNITFCYNGGKCRVLGYGDGYCNCDGTGYTGPKCEKRNEQPKVSARTGCSKPNECPPEDSKPYCSHEPSKQPCSCRPVTKSGRVIPKDWVKYEAIIPIHQNYTVLLNQSTIGYELQKNISNWFKSNNLSDLHNVLVSFYPPLSEKLHPRPDQLQIHFHGPYNLSEKVRPVLNQYFYLDASASSFRKQIPILRNKLELYIMPRVKYKDIEVSKQPRLKIGKSVNIACIAVTGRSNYFSTRDISFRWFKDGLPVNTSITTRHMGIFQTPTTVNHTMSILMIDDVSTLDGGRYTCEITDLEFGDQECGVKEVEVILPPQIEVEPMSLTLEKRQLEKGKVITCTDGSYSTYEQHNKTTEFVWSRSLTGDSSKEEITNNNIVVVEDIIPQGKMLRILRPDLLKTDHSVSFTCSGINKYGGEKSKIVQVKVLDSRNSPSCKQHWEPLLKKSEKDNKLVWEWTAPDAVALIPCPKGFTGYVQRKCVKEGNRVYWGRSDFSRCISDRLRRVNLTLQNAMRGFGDWQNCNTIKLMNQLEKYLNLNQVLYPGEGEKIVAIMEDIVKYAFGLEKLGKEKVSSMLFQVFFGTVVKFVKIPNSCVHGKSILTLSKIIEIMAAHGAKQVTANDNDRTVKPHIVSSEVLMLQTLPIISEQSGGNSSYIFPLKEAMTNSTLLWLKDSLRVDFPLDAEGLRQDINSPLVHYLMMAAYKNVSSILVPNDKPLKQPAAGAGQRSFRQSIKLISPVIQISISAGEYILQDGSHIKIHFNLTKEYGSLVSRSTMAFTGESSTATTGTRYSCGALDNNGASTKTDSGRMPWKLDACVMNVQHSGYVECQCEMLGIYGLLRVSIFENDVPEENHDIPRIIVAGFSFCMLSCVLSGAIICVYLKCRISPNSLYALKLFDCLFILLSAFIILLGRTELPSSSWLVWSTCACSFLISSLSIQMTKALRVLLMEASLNLPAFVLPWLKNVSQLTLLSAITFSTVLPVWTATVAKIIGGSSSNESPFQEASHVFVVFVVTVAIIVVIFFALYYKAVLKTKGELDRCRQQNSCSTNNEFASEMIWVLKCRMKTLNRSLCLTLVILIMILGIVLHENIRHSVFIQYFVGLSATAMGIVLFLSYASHSECPIYNSLCKPEKPLRRDPEKDVFTDLKGNLRKLCVISSELNGNSSIAGTMGLLPPPPPPVKHNSSRPFGDESETLSVSTVEEQSMDTFSTEMSFRTAPLPPSHKVSFSKRNNHSLRSTSSNTKSSNGSSCRGSRRISSTYSSDCSVPQPIRGQCFISSGDYILPSVRHTNNTSVHGNPTVQAGESSAASSTSYNYLPIHDPDEIQKKISHDLSILLPARD